MTGVMFDKKILTRMKEKIHRTVIHPAMLYGLETVPNEEDTDETGGGRNGCADGRVM